MSHALPFPIMSRVLAVVGICLFTGGAQLSCSSDGRGVIRDDLDDSGSGATFTTTLVLRNSAGAESYTFQRGDVITFELTVHNRTNQTQRFADCCPPDREFFVFDDGTARLRWKWTEGRAFPAVIESLEFAANETKVLRGEWNQGLSDGSVIAAGRYEARGVVSVSLAYRDPLLASELGSRLREFTIQ